MSIKKDVTFFFKDRKYDSEENIVSRNKKTKTKNQDKHL